MAALRRAFAYCDGAYDALTDASGAEMARPGKTRFAMLNWNLWHTWEHYGNVVVYLRMKGLVPPSSEKKSSACGVRPGFDPFSGGGLCRTASRW